MLLTKFLQLKKPEGSDPVNVQDFNDNADTVDTEINARVKSSGGDISATKIATFDSISTEFPVPAAGDTIKTFSGKISKFFNDFKSYKPSIVTKAMILNQILNDAEKAASAATVYSVNKKVDDVISDLGNVKSKFPTDLSYIAAAIPRIKNIVNKTGSLLEDITWMINFQGIRSGEFGFNNCIYTDSPDSANMKWGYIKYFQHADNYVTVKLYPESSLNVYIRRFTVDTGSWTTNWRKATMTDVV